MVEPILEPFEELVKVKDGIEARIREIESEFKGNRIASVMFGVDHRSLPEALVADIVDAIPIIGEVSNITRIRQSDDISRRFMQSVDLAVDVIPFADLLLPTNTLMYIENQIKGR